MNTPSGNRKRADRSQILFEHSLPSMVLAIVLLPRLFMRGMFFDGLTYGAIARNLSQNIGSFWNPHYTETLHSSFRDHPPFALWMQSLFIRLVSDTFFVDALWSALLALIILNLTIFLARQLTNDSLTPLIAGLLLVMSPLFIWTSQNNLLELTMTIFILAAVGFAWKALTQSSFLAATFFASLMGLSVLLAFLAKGPVAAFPMALPFLWACLFKPKGQGLREGRWIGVTVIGSIILIAAGTGLFLDPQSKSFLGSYLEGQVFNSLAGSREKASSRFFLIPAWFEALAAPLAIMGILVAVRLKASTPTKGKLPSPSRASVVIAAVALCGSLPLLLSPKQSAFYLIPSLPFYCVFFAHLISQLLPTFSLSKRITRAAFWSCLIGLGAASGLAARNSGKPRRTPELYAALDTVKSTVPERAAFEVCDQSLLSDWTLIAVLQREIGSSLYFNPENPLPYRFSQTSSPCPQNDWCQAIFQSEAFIIDHCKTDL